ncbi:hypothetical protein MBSD_n0868 [Mizugakiibacter sediminis]|uniref:GNAT family acetyltransferase n=1 Tax=Mizugakiibacter sediminis TaxID=1475481 RepID=A0A0K8QL23_9GAMM|nr:GNAT family N-acetyltransferase [Mizugakiibacter sediminis]GAP65578.1 hypothetical protein MBSD_n0868 [Mizugakiibacter sediminis]
MIRLVPLDLPNLRRLAAGEPGDFAGMTVHEGGPPPRHVAARALAQLEAGTPAAWCVPYLIVPASRDAVLGGCGFKTAPVDGSVEISYGVAKSQRGRGIATAAVGELLRLAADSGVVREVVAHVLPDNVASSRVVARLGFAPGPAFVDTDGATVVRWAWRLAGGGSERQRGSGLNDAP